MGKKVGDKHCGVINYNAQILNKSVTFLVHNLFSSELQEVEVRRWPMAIKGKGVKALHVMGIFVVIKQGGFFTPPITYLLSFPFG